MKKRGQITIILILGIVILILAGLYFYITKHYVQKNSSQLIKSSSQSSPAGMVKSYAESCLKTVTDEALFNRIGLQGGYISTDGDPTYKDTVKPDSVSFQGIQVPYYVERVCSVSGCNYQQHMPSLDDISKKIGNYISVEFEKCFSQKPFEGTGIEITKPNVKTVEVNANEGDINVILYYPIQIKQKEGIVKIDSFQVTVPIRLKFLFDNSQHLVSKIIGSPSDTYKITSGDCMIYDKYGNTNTYNKSSSGAQNDIVQFVDFSTYDEKYLKSFVFQFAVKNAKVKGDCTRVP